jgi:oxygen-independent coproporphyrinogen-3 oxidase
MAGIYIHIPYCKTKCPYCDFFSVTDISNKSRLIQGIEKELALQKEYLGSQKIETIYFGGGTPSYIEPYYIQKIVDRISAIFQVANYPEITIECNPDDLNENYLIKLRGIADFRINFGVQSFINSELQLLQRRHNAEQTLNILEKLFDLGFKNVGIDLIYGLPGSDLQDFAVNLDTAFQFPIKHLSAYHLTIEKGTPFYDRLQKGEIAEISEDLSRKLYFCLKQRTSENGFEHYEISNFAKNKHYSKHNTSYWQGIPYLGVGPSAHSFDGNNRHWNVSSIGKYLQFIEKDKLACDEEQLTMRDQFNEYLMVSLRTKWGADLNYLKASFPFFVDAEFKHKLNYYQEKEMVYLDNNHIYLTEEGQFLSDRVIMDLFKTER